MAEHSQRLWVEAKGRSGRRGGITLTLRPLVVADPFSNGIGAEEPVLLVCVDVDDDLGLGARYWLDQAEHQWWRNDGFVDHPARGFAADWTIRIEDGTRYGGQPWIAIRYSTDHAGDPVRLCSMALELPPRWMALVRDREEILTLIGPISVAGEAEALPAELSPRRLREMLEYGSLISADAVILQSGKHR